MKVLAFIEGVDHVCYRYRIEAFAWALAERGLLLEAVPLEHNLLGRVRQLRRAATADVAILQRKLLPLWQLGVLRRAARRLVYDVDDSLFRRDSYSRKGPNSRQRLIRFWTTLYAADAVTVGNAYLAQRARTYVEADRVHLVPTCVQPARYPVAAHVRGGASARLAWIGQRSTMPSLQRASGHLAAAAARLPGLELHAISDGSLDLSGIRLVLRPWSSASEAAELADADIGINWLPDDAWSLGKCGLKVLQYMAAGLPVVANPVGMNCAMVLHGQTGFLASSPAEWAAAIARLANDPALRRRMGAAGRRVVEEQFSAERWAPAFAKLLHGLAVGPHCHSEVHGHSERSEESTIHSHSVQLLRCAQDDADHTQADLCGADRCDAAR